jgi:hypothetical protein
MSGLPVLATVLEAWDEIRRNGPALLGRLLMPAIAIGFLEAIGSFTAGSLFTNLLIWALTTPFYVLFAVICHRTVILGPQFIPSAIGLFWSARETRFLGWTIALIIVSWGAGIAIGLIGMMLPTSALGFKMPWLPIVVMGFLGLYFYVRLMLVFPATAVDQATSLSDAWYLTAGHGVRIMASVLIAVIPVGLLGYAAFYFLRDGNDLVFELVAQVLGLIMFAFAVCTVSVAYRTLADLDFIADAS